MNIRGLILPVRIVGCLFLLPALGCLIAAAWFYTSRTAFLKSAATATGTVVNLKPSSGENGTSYFAVFEFTDATGAKHQSTSGWASSPPEYSVGERVKVLYSPDNPTNARIQGFFSLWLGTAICAVIGVTDFITAIAFLWFAPFAIKRVWPAPPPIPQGNTAPTPSQDAIRTQLPAR